MNANLRTAVNAAVGLAGIAALLVAGQEAQPINEVKDAVRSPSSAAHSYCHEGWTADVVQAEHAQSLTCEMDGWTVILHPNGAFNLAQHDGNFYTDPEEVPGW